MTRPWVFWTMVSFGLSLIGWDVALAFDAIPRNTISELIATASAHPILPFLIGILFGHFGWLIKKPLPMI